MRETWHFCKFEKKIGLEGDSLSYFQQMCITTHISSSLPDLFATSWSLSHSDLCQFKMSLLYTTFNHIL
jgi:hypothetical protein